jgi:hypothetical protein
MSKNNHTFPWGIYIGDLIDENGSLPVCLPSETGGVCVIFDDNSETVANNLIENIALKLFDILPIGDISVDVFDFSHRKRFMYLASLQNQGLYHIALTKSEASSRFNELEKIALHRHQNLLSPDTPTISQYNQNNTGIEKYHLLIINLENYPNELDSYKRIKAFFDSSYEAGFYCLVFMNWTNQNLLMSELRTPQNLFKKFQTFNISTKELLNDSLNTLFDCDIIQEYRFEYRNTDKETITKALLDSHKKHEETNESNEKEFLSIPIGTAINGRDKINFSLGEKSKNYHAFITGVTRSGKTTLLNNIILGIAQKYTPQEVRLYLMDYKQGVEFQVFKNHPNCEKIFLDNEDLDASIKLLQGFSQGMNKRSELFKKNEVANIIDYNNLPHQKPIARLILIIDEVHRLFAGNYKQKENFSELLKHVVKQGAGFGIHIILSTQTLAGTQIDRELMSQITLRISFKLSDFRDSESIFTIGNTEAKNLKRYELIYNNESGEKSANVLCKASPPQDIKAAISEVLASRSPSQIIKPVIVKSDPSQVSESPQPRDKKSSKGFDTSSGRELINKLIQEGEVEAPEGFEDSSNGGKNNG